MNPTVFCHSERARQGESKNLFAGPGKILRLASLAQDDTKPFVILSGVSAANAVEESFENTDCHTSDIGHWFAMTDSGFFLRTRVFSPSGTFLRRAIELETGI